MENNLENAKSVFNNYIESHTTVSIQLGAGGGNVPKFKDWFNIDLSGGSLKWNLIEGMPFCPDNSVHYIYHEHFLEHLSRENGFKVLNECYRVLKPFGVMRVALPDLDRCVRVYNDWENSEESQKFKTKGVFLNMCLNGWDHKFLYNLEDLKDSLFSAGFKEVFKVQYKQSKHDIFRNIETRTPNMDSLIVECYK